MGLLAVIKSFVRTTRNGFKISDVQVDVGGGNVITAEHMSSPGDDAFPLVTDYALVSSVDRSGGGVISGYADLINDPVAEKGDKRIYGRDPSPDELVIGIGYATSDSVDQPDSLRANVVETNWRYGYGRQDPETHRVVSFAELPHFNDRHGGARCHFRARSQAFRQG